ncbi:MAG: hypothetical protein RL701_4151 [Pseudomonadota bacterium]
MDERFILSRRALLGGIGAVGLSSLLPRSLVRAADAPPTRLIVVHVPEGMWGGAARPSAGATTLGPIFKALDPYMANIAVLNNLNMKSRDNGPGGDGHHRGVVHMLTGTEMKDENNAGGASIDQKIAAKLGGTSQLASLQLAVRIVYKDTNSKPIWSGASRAVPAEQDPWQAYKRVFTGAGAAPATGGTATASKFDLRKSALDHSLAEITSLRARLGVGDRERLDSYQESLRDIERRLGMLAASGPAGAAAASCIQPNLGASVNNTAEANYPKIAQLQMDMAVAALQCNVTRVISLQFGNSNDQCAYSWLGVNNLGHDLSHNNNNCDPSGSKKVTVYDWYAKQFAYLLGKLQGVTEGDGTLLSNTVVLWASEFSDSNGHASNNLLWFLMGNAGGYFKTGQVLNCGGRSVNDLHVSLQNAFGIADATFGNAKYCQGPLPGLRA